MALLGNARSITGDKRPKCVDCAYHRFYRPDPVLIYSSPKHRCAAAIDLVTGKTIETDCYAMRHRWAECGPDAKLFEKAKAPPPPDDKKPTPEERRRRNVWEVLLIGLITLAILATVTYWLYKSLWASGTEADQPKIIRTGEVSLRTVSVKDGTCCVITARTQLLAQGGSSLWRVQVSPGDWRDCGGDCEEVLRKALAK